MRYVDRFVTLASIMILIASAVLMVVWGKKGQYKATEQKTVAHLPCKTMYKTILRSDSATDLIGFELHEDEDYCDGERKCPTFNAVIKGVDPMSDEYKTVCRDIIADIINSYGDKEVHVNIFDSFEAYKLAIAADEEYKDLSADEQKYTDDHRIATYTYSDDYYDHNFYLYFFPNAAESLRATEVFGAERVM